MVPRTTPPVAKSKNAQLRRQPVAVLEDVYSPEPLKKPETARANDGGGGLEIMIMMQKNHLELKEKYEVSSDPQSHEISAAVRVSFNRLQNIFTNTRSTSTRKSSN